MESRVLVDREQGDNAGSGDNNRPSPTSNANSAYAVSGVVDYSANTPLRQTILAHRDYWHQVKRVKDAIPKLRYVIINLHPATNDFLHLTTTVSLTERMTLYSMTEHDMMKMLQFLCLIL